MIRNLAYIITLCLSCTLTSVFAETQIHQVEEVSNLAADSKTMEKYSRPMVLELAALDCPYCRMIEENVLVPMLISGDYDDRVLIRTVDIFNHSEVIDFNGEKITQSDIAKRYGIVLTPTLLFLDHTGKVIVDQMLGVPNLDFYTQYLDANIDKAIEIVKSQ